MSSRLVSLAPAAGSAGARSSSRLRRRAAILLLAVFSAWPPIHLRLVARFDLSPWKLAGWGMYSAPRPETFGMEVYGLQPGSTQRQHLAAPSSALLREASAFLENYRWLRRLARPRRFAEAVLREHPQWERLEIEVFRSELDAKTGMIVMKQTVFTFPELRARES